VCTFYDRTSRKPWARAVHDPALAERIEAIWQWSRRRPTCFRHAAADVDARAARKLILNLDNRAAIGAVMQTDATSSVAAQTQAGWVVGFGGIR
jgi:hypothetical protein